MSTPHGKNSPSPHGKNLSLTPSSHNSLLLYGSPINPSRPNIHIIEFPASELKEFKIDMCAQPYEKLDSKLASYKSTTLGIPQILSNASFFATSTGGSIFNLISNSTTYSRNTDSKYLSGFGVTKGNSAQTFDSYKIIQGKVDEYFWRDFMTGYPILVKDSVAITNAELNSYSDINYGAHRNCFGWTKNQEYFFFMAIQENCKLNTVRDAIFEFYPDVEFAVNLDGGGSTDLYCDGSRITTVDYQRKIDSCISVWLRSDDEREAENNTQEPITPDTPEQQYKIRYAVQVGSFSKRENAERMLEELKSKGYDGYIYTKYLPID